MIHKDKTQANDFNIALADYLASFWNAEAVKKVQEARKSSGNHRFKNDEEFEKSMIERTYKENPLLDAVIKLRNLEDENIATNSRHPKTKMPTDLSAIYKTLNKFKE